MSVRDDSNHWRLPILCLLFFGSGFAALIYQVVWLRSLSLVFGVTVYAASTVLASFMAGLAAGSYLAGRIAGGLRRPLVAFAIAELGVGLSGIAVSPVITALTAAYASLQPHLPESFALLTTVRFVGSLLVLLVPTSLMGATLPLLVQATAGDPRVGTRLGALYATNTGGAIVGALVAGFALVPDLGLSAAARIAATVNAAVAIAAIVLARRWQATAGTVDPPPDPAAPDVDMPTRRAVLVTFVLSGVLSLALEVIWFRILALHLRPTAYAFTIMLAAVLAGIAGGSYIVTPLLTRPRPWLAVLAALQLLIALAAVLSLNTLGAVTAVSRAIGPVLGVVGMPEYVLPLVSTSLVAMLPTSLLLGAAFPIGLRLFVGRGTDVGRRVSIFYALNVCGAIAGAVLGGFVLLPLLGSRGTIVVVSALALVSSLLVAYRVWPTWPNAAGFLSLVGPVAFLMAALNATDPFADLLRRAHRGERLLWFDEGVQTTVSVHRRPSAAGIMRVMYLDGMHQADDSGGTAFTHHSLGALPMMLHQAPKRVLVIGLGGGATAGAIARFPGAEIDVVELSPEVVRGSAFFGAINFDVLTRPGVTLRVDDGRNFLLTTDKRYDVITADIIHPTHVGATTVYSKEYFELVRRALAPGGLVMQWIGPRGDFEFKLLARTFLTVFPESTLWGDGSLIAGRLEPMAFSAARHEQRRTDPAFRALFDWDLATMRRLYVAGPAALRAFVGDGPLLTDDRPIIEYFLSVPTPNPMVDLAPLTGSFDDVLRP